MNKSVYWGAAGLVTLAVSAGSGLWLQRQARKARQEADDLQQELKRNRATLDALARELEGQTFDRLHGQYREARQVAGQVDSVADPDALRGLEGAGAAHYFPALAAAFPPELGFTGRSRRPPRDPVNACLSLGYSLLYAEAVLACHRGGLDPMLGFYHRPAYNHRALASDLIEALRPRVDRLVWELFRSRRLRGDQFHQEGGGWRLGRAASKVFFPDYEHLARPVRRYLRRFCRSLGDGLLAYAPQWPVGEDDL